MTKAAPWHGRHPPKGADARPRQPRTMESKQAHYAKHLAGNHLRGNVNHKVKFSRAMWDRMMADQHEYAALRKMPLGDA